MPRYRLAVMAAAMITACAVPEPGGRAGVLDARLTDGRQLRDLIGPADTAVVLLYDPGDCFVCYSELASWMELRRKRAGLVRIILTREATVTEAHQLTMYRIVADGVIRMATEAGGIATPAYLLVVSDTIVGRWTATDGPSPLLGRFRP